MSSISETRVVNKHHHMILRSKSPLDYHRLAGLDLTQLSVTEPNTVKEALVDPKLRVAMEDELKALYLNKTWSLFLPLAN